MITKLNIDLIVSDTELRGGRPIINGTTLRVSDVAAYHIFGGLTAEDIAVQFNLSLGQAHAALAYYFTHKVEIDQEIHDNAEGAEKYLRELKKQRRVITFRQ